MDDFNAQSILSKLRKLFIVLVSILVLYVTAWLVLNLFFPHDSVYFDYYTDSYGFIAGVGGLTGFYVAAIWDGFKSKVGRSLLMFSLGLFFQFLGQVSYAIYYYVYNIDNPYPSFGEVFYFGSIPIYIYAIWLMADSVGFKGSFGNVLHKLSAFVIPVAMVFIAYTLFLRNYTVDYTVPIRTFLDFGYPLGQAVYVSLAILTFWLSRDVLGGKLKRSVLFILAAMLVQYLADTTFLYSTFNEFWRPGGLDDLFFLFSYFLMGWAILKFGFEMVGLRQSPTQE